MLIQLMKLYKFFFATLFLSLSVNNFAIADSIEKVPSNIAIIYDDILLSKSEVVKNLKHRIEELIAQNQIDFKSKEAELKAREAELKEKKNVLSNSKNKELIKDFDAELLDFNRLLKSTQQDFRAKKDQIERMHKESIKKIKNEITLILADMTKEYGFNFVIPANQFIWFSPSADITSEVLNRLNKNIQHIKLELK